MLADTAEERGVEAISGLRGSIAKDMGISHRLIADPMRCAVCAVYH